MAAFPDVLTNQPIRVRWQYRTTVREAKGAWGSGREIRKRLGLYPTWMITLAPERCSAADARTFLDFFLARSGSYEAFTWIAPFTEEQAGRFVGIANGSGTQFNLPVKSGVAEDYVVYVDGIEQNESDYTITAGTGQDGVDKLTFDVAPADGTIVTIDFNGYPAYRCRFADDGQEVGCLTSAYTMIEEGVELQGVIENGII